jgi:hypothetical protein
MSLYVHGHLDTGPLAFSSKASRAAFGGVQRIQAERLIAEVTLRRPEPLVRGLTQATRWPILGG